jgi:abhydrolase domain-containing protein 6
VEGVRSSDHSTLVSSVFFKLPRALPSLLNYYHDRFNNKYWKKALLRTVRGTIANRVRGLLPRVECPVLVICGKNDRITSTDETIEAIRGLSNYRCVVLSRCGHAPQIERSGRVNRLVRRFLTSSAP